MKILTPHMTHGPYYRAAWNIVTIKHLREVSNEIKNISSATYAYHSVVFLRRTMAAGNAEAR